ncbi:MAG: hypothetical protein AAFQ42_11800 [Pseudomonadota bacterium]
MFAMDDAISAWRAVAKVAASEAVLADENQAWFRYGRTWFAGVNALANDPAGRVGEGPPLAGAPIDFVTQVLGLVPGEDFVWDSGQLSIVYPGYPKPMAGETDGAYNYRVKRDAAHVDGIHPIGGTRRRHIREPHAFILGIPLTSADAGASPLVVWEGSHEVVRETLAERLAGTPVAEWPDVDLTEIYQAMRRRIFETCLRRIVNCAPGESYLVHRLALHGVAPWSANARADAAGRAIAYFRPEPNGTPQRTPEPGFRDGARALPVGALKSWLHAP